MTKHWKRLEDLVAKDINGRVRPGSGKYIGSKEDVASRIWLVQCKSFKSRDARIELEDMNNLAGHAEMEKLIPVFIVAPMFRYGNLEYFCVLALPDFADMLDEDDSTEKIDMSDSITISASRQKGFNLHDQPLEDQISIFSIEGCHPRWGKKMAIIHRSLFIDLNRRIEEI